MKELEFFNIIKNIFSTKIYLLISFLFLSLMLFISFFVKSTIIPSFKEQVISNIIDNTTRLAFRISKNMDFENLSKDDLSKNLALDLSIFKISKIHYFDKYGKIIYSTKKEKIDNQKIDWYFSDVLTKGKIYYEIEKNDKNTLLEVYVPILKGGDYQGAFELYYDITNEMNSFEELSTKIMSLVLFSGTFFSMIFLIVMYNASKSNLKLKNNEGRLKELANTDSLTKLYNRRYFYKIATKILKLSQRAKQDICICMIDIDNFKNINDTYGHHLGDYVIKNLAKKLNTLTRQSDIVARYGGEEFVLLFPNTSIEGAQIIAKKICKEISEQKLINKKINLSYTISLGLSLYNGEDSIDDFIIKADESLYKAKHAGKNQVIF